MSWDDKYATYFEKYFPLEMRIGQNYQNFTLETYRRSFTEEARRNGYGTNAFRGLLLMEFQPKVKENRRYYHKLMKRAMGTQRFGGLFRPCNAELDLLEAACLKILDLPVALDENPELFYEFHPLVRKRLLKDEYIPLFHDVDEHKELNAAKVEIEALKAELAEAKEKLAAIEAEKTKTKNTLESELASVLTPPAYNPFD